MKRLLTGPELDRLDAIRGGSAALPSRSRVLLVHAGLALLRDGEIVTEGLAEVRRRDPAMEVSLLGERDGIRWAVRSVGGSQAEVEAERLGGEWAGLRTATAWLEPWAAGLLAYAASLMAWQERARHCGRCGSEMRLEASGHRRVCTDDGCGTVAFPRADPAVITLVRRGERALLVHQPSWPAGRLSSLAGFVEPGESLEEAVAREVFEETGLGVEGVEYLASQPWPFPHTLMVAYRSEVGPGEVVLNDELDEARWFTRAELREAIEAGAVTIPPPVALSRHLIEDWLEG